MTCVYCNQLHSKEKIFKIPMELIYKFEKLMRSFPTQKQLNIQQKDILRYIKPIKVLDHKEKENENGIKQKVKELTIGVIKSYNEVNESRKFRNPCSFQEIIS